MRGTRKAEMSHGGALKRVGTERRGVDGEDECDATERSRAAQN